jgi:hypothetical protein
MRVPTTKGAQNTPLFPTRDHVIPKSFMPGQGFLIVCRTCNLDKRNRTLADWCDFLERRNDRRSVIVRELMKHSRHLMRADHRVGAARRPPR